MKSPCLILKRWINNSREKPKDIRDKNKDLTEYHKKEMSLERNKIRKISWGAYTYTTSRIKFLPFFLQKELESLERRGEMKGDEKWQ